jgi:regulator of cell morphogenesis and NO signaling
MLPLSPDVLSSYRELNEIGVDRDFVYALLRTFESENEFVVADYQKFPLQIIIDYIRRTHRYYVFKKLPEIEQSIDILLKDYSDIHPLLPVLNTFYADYRKNLTEHIKFEEAHLLPYIEILLRVEGSDIPDTELHNNGQFSLKGFIENHDDTEDDLSRVRNIIQQYQPPSTNQTPYRILISQLQAFEKDLNVHALIEDQILVPRALELERNALAELRRRTKSN